MNYVVDITKYVRLPDEQFYLIAGCFDTRIAGIETYRIKDQHHLPNELALQYYEFSDKAEAGPFTNSIISHSASSTSSN